MKTPSLLALVLSTFLLGTLGAADRPHILWLTSEDHGPEMGAYGDENARTPNVDALAERGMIFHRAWSTAPVCAPARTAIIAGLYPSRSGGLHMRSMVPLPDEIRLYPEYLREAGYYCTNAGKEDFNVRKPDDLWDESSGKAHWKNRADDQPFFAIFNSTKSHESRIRTRPHEAVADPADMRVPAYHPDTPEVRQDWAQYYDKVSEADADAGERLREVEEAGLAGDTIVFYYGDHGHGLPRGKRWPSDSGLRVPMVVHFPEKWHHLAPEEYEPGGTSDRMVDFVDLAPTVLSLANIEPPEWMQGHAFAGPHQVDPPAYLFGERGRMDERMDLVRSVTDGRYVYLRNYFPHVSQAQRVDYQFQTPTTQVWHALFEAGETNEAQSIFWRVPKAPEELYDLETDPDEVNNLAGSAEHRTKLEELRKAHLDHIAAIGDVCFLPEGEIHSRSEGRTPYELATDPDAYPQARIVETAGLASNLEPEALSELTKRLDDPDSAVRWWAALGHLMRGADAVTEHEPRLLRALREDDSPHVRVAAAEALGKHGDDESRAAALETLAILAPPRDNGVFVSMAALAAIEALGDRADYLHPLVAEIDPKGPSPDGRYDSYVPRLIQNITGEAASKR
ncbi:MAG: sulfatase-like hydrolase/transferase [Verrucomicrobiales bacterium]